MRACMHARTHTYTLVMKLDTGLFVKYSESDFFIYFLVRFETMKDK